MCSSRRFSRNRINGHTLVEMLIYCGLLILLLTAIYAVVIASLRYCSVHQGCLQMEQGASTILDRVAWELAESRSGCFRSDNSSLVFASPRSLTNSPFEFVTLGTSTSLGWRTYICYYVTNAKLFRQQVPIAGAPLANPPAAASLPSTSQFTGGNALADNVGSFSTTTDQNLCKVTLTMQKATVSLEHPDTISVMTEMLLRN